MSHSPIGPTAQVGPANPYLILLLRQTLGEQGWTMQRLALAMRWDQEIRAEVTELAIELGLLTHASLIVKAKAKALPLPQTADILILPVSLRPRAEPSIKQHELPSERREPAPWSVEGLAEIVEAQPERQPTPPVSWIVDRENDDG
jgi:hypothetical protein